MNHKIESRLLAAADELWANSKLNSSKYSVLLVKEKSMQAIEFETRIDNKVTFICRRSTNTPMGDLPV